MVVLTCSLRRIAGTAFASRMMKNKILVLFDIDGTLTEPVQTIKQDMDEFLQTKVKSKYSVGLVGGSDFKKIAQQMGGDDVIKRYDYVFAENGLIAYKNGTQLESQSIHKHIGEEKLQEFINYSLLYMSGLSLPVKRGTFVEFRTGMINLSPVGRSCSQAERIEFYEYDKVHRVREKFIAALKEKFPHLGLKYSIGGQISFDVFPIGWDKTYCLNILDGESFDEIHFFGDRTDRGGNDHEIFSDARTIGHRVTSPEDTRLQLEGMLARV